MGKGQLPIFIRALYKGKEAHLRLSAGGNDRPSVAWCFGVARPRFWRLEGCNLELVSCRFRKQRSAQAAEDRRPGPSFSFCSGVARPRFWRLEG